MEKQCAAEKSRADELEDKLRVDHEELETAKVQG